MNNSTENNTESSTENRIEFNQDWIEQVIAGQAIKVCNYVQMRRTYPSYGYTKTAIRAELHKLEGMLALYGVLLGQASHASGVGWLTKVRHPKVKAKIDEARRAVEEMA